MKGGGGGGESRRFGGSHGFHCCQRVYRRDLELTTKKGRRGGGGCHKNVTEPYGGSGKF